MKAKTQQRIRTARLVLAAIACGATVAPSSIVTAGTSTALDSGERTTVSFSDPSRPGTLQVKIVTGSILVKGGDAKDVIIDARRGHFDFGSRDPDAPPGMRRLSLQPSFTVEEQDNRMSIEDSSPMVPVEFEVQVPRRTNLQLSTVNGGDIVIDGVDGDLELADVNGSIKLTNVSGSVVAHTINGKVSATMARVSPQKPMSFTSLNGAIDVTLPAAIRADLQLRSDRGSVFTDFYMSVLPQPAPTVDDTRKSGGRYRIEVNKAIYGHLNGGGQEIELRSFNGNIYLRKGS
jgi:hypothetical protein